MKPQVHLKSRYALALSMGMLLSYQAFAQSQTHFEDVSIPESAESYSQALDVAPDSYSYVINSGHIEMRGIKEFWGGFTGFDCSKSTNNIDFDYNNDKSSIVGAGSESTTHYGIAYLNADWPENPSSTLPLGLKITGDAAHYPIISMDITNTTYGYYWILENIATTSFIKLTVKGYNEGIESDNSIEYYIVQKTDTDTFVLNSWHTLELITLGAVDSLTFKLESDNDWAPFYFAFDNIKTSNNSCASTITEVHINDISYSSASAVHTSAFTSGIQTIEYAIDTDAIIIPSGTTSTSSELTINLDGLNPETSYTYHFRTQCINGIWSDWDTVQFNTYSLNIRTTEQDNNLIIHPNPATDFIHITGDIKDKRYLIINMTGQVVAEGQLISTLDIQSWTPGIYMMQVIEENTLQTLSFKIIKK